MSIPLDRLYNFLHDLCNHDDILIYRFFPHGSKKLDDLKLVNQIRKIQLIPIYVLCHDQEPLHWNLYSSTPTCTINLRAILSYRGAMYDEVLLVHSEKQSPELDHYELNGFIGVYYWSHAIIARDWFRYAKIDPILSQKKQPAQDFLVYNRAWSGTREYRLKFTELVVDYDLVKSCNMKFNPVEETEHYQNHKFVNSVFRPVRYDLEQYFSLSAVGPTASADYNNADYAGTAIEVVLETLFDDQRWQLTEKALRPIACGHPFMLAASQGSLEYLRSYGFKTFAGLINEDYDTIVDHRQRLEAIVSEMKRIASLSPTEKQKLYSQLEVIAAHNRKHFFSDKFMDQVITEYKTNLELGLNRITA